MSARAAFLNMSRLLAMVAVGAAAPVAAQPNSSTLEAAREAARTDRNAASARLFEEYLRANPSERTAVLREYADQLVYSGRPEAAIPLFREVLARPGIADDERRAAQRGYALALAWSDQHRQAAAAYEAILAESPGDERALVGRAKALQWMGRPDSALAALGGLGTGAEASSEARSLLADIDLNRRPLSRAVARFSEQSDDLEISAYRIDQSFHARSGAIEIRPFFERIEYRPETGGKADVNHPGIGLRARVSDALQVSGELGVERQRFAGGKRSLTIYEAALALLPRDDFRFDLVAARRTFDNIRSIERGISADQFFASADYWPTPMWRLTARAEHADFSDGNERQWAQGEVERRLSRSPNIFLGAKATTLRFSRLLDNGYFNPRSLQSAELTARGWGEIAPRTWLDLAAGVGPEHADPGGTKLAYSGRAKLTHAISERLEASLTAEGFSSRTLTSGGFSRRSLIAAIGLRW